MDSVKKEERPLKIQPSPDKLRATSTTHLTETSSSTRCNSHRPELSDSREDRAVRNPRDTIEPTVALGTTGDEYDVGSLDDREF